MKTSQFLISTLKEAPAEAELPSHRLMIRAGLIKRLASGLYTWMPLGLRVLRKVETIVRNEMNDAGALELLMPSVQPAELWQESGRWEFYGPELLRLKDRHERSFCYGPTHEEVITDVARREIKSYKQLPLNFYQIQTKFRDEIRPRFGVMRAREFIMKDAYSFHSSQDSLQQTYDVMYQTYSNIFNRLGLKFRAVRADTGAIGGAFSHEFHVLADSGEDAIAYSPNSDYAANIELAEGLKTGRPSEELLASIPTVEKIHTPNQKTIEEVSNFLKLQSNQAVKTLIVVGKEEQLIALVVRGDHTLNDVKTEKLANVKVPLQFASEEQIKATLNCNTGSIGVVGLAEKGIEVIIDYSVENMTSFACGANENDYHLVNVQLGRDCPVFASADIREVVVGDPCIDGSGALDICRGIEVGHIFQLGTKYAQAMNCNYLDENGKTQTAIMGCYGVGVSRIVGACIEQNFDEKGIIFPEAMSPFTIAIVPIGMKKSEKVKEIATQLYDLLKSKGIDVLLDDRDERPGVLFADMDLIGIPHRIVIGDKGLANQTVEYKARRATEAENIQFNHIDDLLTFIQSKLS